ncbi:NAD(P)-dependent oxidoreductase [Hypericibacter adhaerens]|jgi:dTDP-4-dehydrorhamnose reductase|uniref:dTDP-4-dehydrorhamnose reductase n=1 Tax=Hypericibacter adhaerens TaxID=2602016 RepID=A0A5J6MV89_9PROT|nr:dTDP-4-dehydrorhamnose reductase [Hypericibacter adhaerens]QEX21588.1 NAD(P)-dependent oxidoreductase [Hypericibacter adhaerens]
MAHHILVAGRSGQIARELARAALPGGFTLECRGRESLDLMDPARTARLVAESGADIVINAAAYTAVDKAESESDLAFRLNRDGAAALAEGAAARGAALLHISTDYVFDGTKPTPYDEEDPVNPISVYGASKEAGERAVRERIDRHVILRTAWVYSPFGEGSFVRTMMRLGAERPELRIIDDQHGSPTAATDVAQALVAVAAALIAGKADGYGTFHFCNAGSTTRFGQAEAIFAWLARRGRTVPRVTPIPSSAYPMPARRPANSVLDCGRIGRVYGILPRDWHEALEECMAEIVAAGATKDRS